MTKGPEGRQSEYAELITFHNGNNVIEIFFKCHNLLPQKAGFDTSWRCIHGLRKLEIRFLLEDGLGTFCLTGTFLTSLTLSNPPATVTSGDGRSFVLPTLPVSSLASVWRWCWVWDVVISSQPLSSCARSQDWLAICFGAEMQHWSKCVNYFHAPHFGWKI